MSNQISTTVTQAVLNPTALKWSQNMADHYKAIDVAVERGSDLLVIPELSLTGYEVGDEFRRTDNDKIFKALSRIARYAYTRDPDLIVSLGCPWRLQRREPFKFAEPNPDNVKNPIYDRLSLPFNVQTLIGGNRILGMTAKANLFNDERGYEKRHFNEWSFQAADVYSAYSRSQNPYGTITIELPDGQSVPFGRPLIHIQDKGGAGSYIHATAICEEKWVATRFDQRFWDAGDYEHFNIIPSIERYLGSKQGLLLEISNASPPAREKQKKHMELIELASRYADAVIDTDNVGTSGSAFAQSGGARIAQDERTISAGERMSFGAITATTSTVVLGVAPESARKRSHGVFKRAFKNASAPANASFIWDTDPDNAWDNPKNPDQWKEERIRNQALWTYDYIRKVGSTVAVNASSGGQDSGYNITIDYLAIVLAMKKLGVEGVCDDLKVPYKKDVMDAFEQGGEEAAIEAFMSHYLIMYYMPTNNNSDDHESGARALSEGGIDDKGQRFKGLGGRFVVRSIQDLVTMSAFVFGTENTSEIDPERKLKIMMELSDFVHAHPKKYTPEQMQEWANRLQTEYPELQEVTSVALPGQSIAYENFQARLRTVLIWAAANVHGGMPRANPNLSEGYTNNTTAAGDLQGGAINPNGGMFKDDEQELLRYLEEKGLHNVVPPIKALSVINGNEPSAGLLPMDDGEVVQNDQDTMQAEMPQISIMARLMHQTTVSTDNGERELNFGEVLDRVKVHPAFKKLNDNQLFNTVANFYRRWYSGQFKIHMGVIQSTFGESVDHQFSRRTPNFSGGSKDEIIQAALNMMYEWSHEDGNNWSDEEYGLASERSWQDQAFIDAFFDGLWNRDEATPNMTYNVRQLYNRINDEGWDNVVPPLNDNHPIRIVLEARLER